MVLPGLRRMLPKTVATSIVAIITTCAVHQIHHQTTSFTMFAMRVVAWIVYELIVTAMQQLLLLSSRAGRVAELATRVNVLLLGVAVIALCLQPKDHEIFSRGLTGLS